MSKTIPVEVMVAKDVALVWKCFNAPEHVTKWALASNDASMSFEIPGTYTDIDAETYLAYKLDDGRTITVRCPVPGSGQPREDPVLLPATLDPPGMGAGQDRLPLIAADRHRLRDLLGFWSERSRNPSEFTDCFVHVLRHRPLYVFVPFLPVLPAGGHRH